MGHFTNKCCFETAQTATLAVVDQEVWTLIFPVLFVDAIFISTIISLQATFIFVESNTNHRADLGRQSNQQYYNSFDHEQDISTAQCFQAVL